ncbi:MAG: hypothetical protein BRC31_00415 [Actinobacteria bacterium QS_5_72_10]|nr:MAG: hypothetical protein BRC31_00415 [Actinobacteria bacterium QS_5_72_10]
MTSGALRVTVLAVTVMLLVAAVAVVAPRAAWSQAVRDLDVSTDFPTVAVEPGERAKLDLQVRSTPAAPVELAVAGAPEGWDTSLRGGGFVVGEVFADPDDAISPSLSAEFPQLEETADTTFNFDLQLDNPTPRELTLRLEASGPQGWQVSANPVGEQAATTVTVPAGGTERLSVQAEPPPQATAGAYPIVVRATGADQPVETELTARITGTHTLTLAAADQRLNVEVQAGETSEKTMVVRNEGTAPLRDVQLQASPPSGWDASFSPGRIRAIPAGEPAEVTLAVTPSEDAVTGDYMTTVSANASQAQDQVDVRTSVETSGLWGLIGAGLVVVALGALGGVFRKFGRR